MISFIIADNQDITRIGLHGCIKQVFREDADIKDAFDRKTLVALLGRVGGKGVVILDYTLFDINGIDELNVISARYPDVHWLLFSDELSDDLIRKVCAMTNVSIVMKDNSGEEIRSALVCTAKGQRYLCHQIANLLAQGFAGQSVRSVLTATETEILRLIAKGATVKEMAAERNCSTHTIITHKKNIFRKIGVNNIYEATKYALRAGLIEVMEYYI